MSQYELCVGLNFQKCFSTLVHIQLLREGALKEPFWTFLVLQIFLTCWPDFGHLANLSTFSGFPMSHDALKQSLDFSDWLFILQPASKNQINSLMFFYNTMLTRSEFVNFNCWSQIYPHSLSISNSWTFNILICIKLPVVHIQTWTRSPLRCHSLVAIHLFPSAYSNDN